MSVEQRYRYLYKPGVFVASLVPAALLVAGALGWFGTDLGRTRWPDCCMPVARPA